MVYIYRLLFNQNPPEDVHITEKEVKRENSLFYENIDFNNDFEFEMFIHELFNNRNK